MEASRTEAAAMAAMQNAREYELDVPAGSKCRAVDTEDAAPWEEPVGGTVSGEGPTGMDSSAGAGAYSRPYYDAM